MGVETGKSAVLLSSGPNSLPSSFRTCVQAVKSRRNPILRPKKSAPVLLLKLFYSFLACHFSM